MSSLRHQSKTRLLYIFLICLYSPKTTLSQNYNYTKFLSQVCDETDDTFDPCSCNLGQWSVNGGSSSMTDFNCFTQFNCFYDRDTDEFCNGNGYCDFMQAECECDREYGGDDCGEQFTQFSPSSVLMFGMIFIAAILLLITLSLMLWVHKYRDVGDVKAMSVVFTHLTLVGCTSVCAGSMVIGTGYNEANCMILEWFQFIGICIIISCALLKAYRIASIFGASNFSPSQLTDTVLLKYFFIMMFVDIFFLAIYTIFNFVEGGSYDRYIEATLYKEVRCSSEPLTMLSYSLLVAWQLVLLLFVLKYGNATRSAAKVFKETKCIYVGSNIGAIMFIAFGIFVLFTTNYTLQIVIRGYGSLTVVLMVLSLLFYPKFKAVYNLKKASNSDIEVDDGGLDQQERDLMRQYEANVKDPNGKELLLLLDALVRELAYRADMKMLSIELKDIDLIRCLKLLDDVKKLVPQPLQEQYNKDKVHRAYKGKLSAVGDELNFKPKDLIKDENSNKSSNNQQVRPKGNSLASRSHVSSGDDVTTDKGGNNNDDDDVNNDGDVNLALQLLTEDKTIPDHNEEEEQP